MRIREWTNSSTKTIYGTKIPLAARHLLLCIRLITWVRFVRLCVLLSKLADSTEIRGPRYTNYINRLVDVLYYPENRPTFILKGVENDQASQIGFGKGPGAISKPGFPP